jgi:hypothetical protein
MTVTPSGGLPTWFEQGPGPVLGTGSIVSGAPAGKSPVAGAVNVLAADPSDKSILYAGTVNGGIWKTINADSTTGPNWTALTDEYPSLSIGALAFDPADSGHHTLWAGVGRRSSMTSTGRETTLAGLMRTTNDGADWEFVAPGMFLNKEISSIVAVKPAATPGQQVIVVGASGGVFRSTDGGTSWAAVSGSAGATSLPTVAPDDIVAGAGANLYASFAKKGVFRSTDGGATWSLANGNLPAGAAAKGTRIRLSVHVGALSEVLYAGFAASPIGRDGKPDPARAHLDTVYRSPDGGAHWASMNHPSTVEAGHTVGLHSLEQADTHLSIAADPANPNVVYVGGDTGDDPPYVGRIFRGVVSGGATTWTLVVKGGANNTAPHSDSRNLVFDPTDPTRLLECDDGGVFVLQSPSLASRSWGSLNGNLGPSEITFAAYDPVRHAIVAGFQDNGTAAQTVLFDNFTWNELGKGDGGIPQTGASDENADGVADAVYYANSQYIQFMTRTVVNGSNGAILSSGRVPQAVSGVTDRAGNPRTSPPSRTACPAAAPFSSTTATRPTC